LSIFVMYTLDLSIPDLINSSSKRLPALPANGFPVLSSLDPGASPISMILAL